MSNTKETIAYTTEIEARFPFPVEQTAPDAIKIKVEVSQQLEQTIHSAVERICEIAEIDDPMWVDFLGGQMRQNITKAQLFAKTRIQ